jgi:hypothetical protein
VRGVVAPLRFFERLFTFHNKKMSNSTDQICLVAPGYATGGRISKHHDWIKVIHRHLFYTGR